MPATEDRVALITSRFRYHEAQNAGVRTLVPTASSDEVPGYFSSEAGAAIHNAAIFALASNARAAPYKVVVPAVMELDFDGKTPRISGADVPGLDPAAYYIIIAAEVSGSQTILTVRG